jgi:hypothetical protein
MFMYMSIAEGAEVLQERAEAQTARLDDIRNQSATIKHYTRIGFEKRPAPAVLFHALHAYFEVHKMCSDTTPCSH